MCRHNFGDDIMHNCQDIEENRCFSNGGTNLHIHAMAQGRPEDNQVEFLQGPHGIVNPPKNLVLNNNRRFTQMANGLYCYRRPLQNDSKSKTKASSKDTDRFDG